MRRRSVAILIVGLIPFSLVGCGGPGTPAAGARITGFAEPCVGSQNSPVELQVVATHGTMKVTAIWIQDHGTNTLAHDLIVANISNRWRPTFTLRVSAGVYRLTSFDGGIDAPLLVATRIVMVGARGRTQDLPTNCK